LHTNAAFKEDEHLLEDTFHTKRALDCISCCG